MSFRKATTASAIGVGLLTTALLIVGAASAWARTPSSTVRFHGYRLSVPSSWPVFDLARHPSTCVRFNRHALYLGVPGHQQQCAAHAVGRTAAILVTPLSAAASRASGGRGAIIRGGGSATSYVDPSAGVQVTATWDGDRSLMARILKRRLAAQRVGPAPRSAGSQTRARSAMRSASMLAASAQARAIPDEATYDGLGFDACSTPSSTEMSDWSSSPYRAIGVYIGGVNAACSQPNLTAAWVSGEVSAGWHLIPIYAGLQSDGSSCGCATISANQANAEGAAAASDAVTQAQALGIPAGNPIYDDMESYNRTSSNTLVVLAFLSGWTTQLHAEGYLSGVYSSASTGITDLVNANGTGYTEPDDIWIGDWNGQHTTSDPYVPAADWADQQRLHQYSGGQNETYGGTTINIDGDYLGGATADTGSLIPDGTFVQVYGTSAVSVIAGGAPLYVSDLDLFNPAPTVDVISAQQFAALSPYPVNGTFLSTTSGYVYRVAGGAPISVTNWDLFGPTPQPTVEVDQWDLDNLSNPLSHLLAAPVDGTVVEGLPSQTYWSFNGGERTEVPPTAGAIQVDDRGLAAFAQAPDTGGVGPAAPTPHVAAPKCVVPRLKHMSLERARRALRQARCRLGTVRRPRHWGRHHLLRVFGQSVAPNSKRREQTKVNIRLI
jgi:hypothetical protein